MPISEHINRLVAMRLQCDIMGVSNLVIARTDSEAATLLTTNIDPRDHAFILGSTNPNLLPLNDLMLAAELSGKSGPALQQIEDEWTQSAGLKTYPVALAEALAAQGLSESKVKDFTAKLAKLHLGRPAALQLAQKEYGLKTAPHFDWDSPRTREGYFRYQGGTSCAINRAVAFAPYADLLWMETKSPIYAQAKEFAEGVHKERPGHWLAYNLSPSFNWEKAGMGEKETREYVWELGKLGFIFQFITVRCAGRGPEWKGADDSSRDCTRMRTSRTCLRRTSRRTGCRPTLRLCSARSANSARTCSRIKRCARGLVAQDQLTVVVRRRLCRCDDDDCHGRHVSGPESTGSTG